MIITICKFQQLTVALTQVRKRNLLKGITPEYVHGQNSLEEIVPEYVPRHNSFKEIAPEYLP